MPVIGTPDGARRSTPTRDLAAYLHGEYRAGVPWRLTVREPSKTGYQLHDRVVSRLEIAAALRLLPWRQRRLVELHFEAGLTRVAVCGRLAISEATFHRDKAEALRTLVGAIYEWGQDEPAA
jgi:DNA-directed RNA polymerase specialized sigma24 family protein